MTTTTESERSRTRSRVRRLLGGAGAIGIGLLLSACHYVGSGTVASATGHGPATFNFNFNCPTGTNSLSGALIYDDPAANVHVQAVLNQEYVIGGCAPTDFFGYGSVSGTYTSRVTAGTGSFTLSVTGATDATHRGTFDLVLFGGPYSGYHDHGTVSAGGIVGIDD